MLSGSLLVSVSLVVVTRTPPILRVIQSLSLVLASAPLVPAKGN